MNKGKIIIENVQNARTVHLLLEVLDEIALQNRHNGIDDLLISIFVERDDTHKYFKHYCGQLLLNNEIEREIIKLSNDGKHLLKKYRIRIILHYQACLELLRRRLETLSPGGLQQAPELLHQLELLKKLEFLLTPVFNFKLHLLFKPYYFF